MQLHRGEIGLSEFLLPVRFEANGHRRTENGQPFVQADDLLLVQPQQGAIKQLGRDLLLDLEQQIGFQLSLIHI